MASESFLVDDTSRTSMPVVEVSLDGLTLAEALQSSKQGLDGVIKSIPRASWDTVNVADTINHSNEPVGTNSVAGTAALPSPFETSSTTVPSVSVVEKETMDREREAWPSAQPAPVDEYSLAMQMAAAAALASPGKSSGGSHIAPNTGFGSAFGGSKRTSAGSGHTATSRDSADPAHRLSKRTSNTSDWKPFCDRQTAESDQLVPEEEEGEEHAELMSSALHEALNGGNAPLADRRKSRDHQHLGPSTVPEGVPVPVDIEVDTPFHRVSSSSQPADDFFPSPVAPRYSAGRYSYDLPYSGRNSYDRFSGRLSHPLSPLNARTSGGGPEDVFAAEARQLHESGLDVGPPTLIEDATGQQFIVRPVRPSWSLEPLNVANTNSLETTAAERLASENSGGIMPLTPTGGRFLPGSSPPMRPSFSASFPLSPMQQQQQRNGGGSKTPSRGSSTHEARRQSSSVASDVLEALAGMDQNGLAQLAAMKAANGDVDVASALAAIQQQQSLSRTSGSGSSLANFAPAPNSWIGGGIVGPIRASAPLNLELHRLSSLDHQDSRAMQSSYAGSQYRGTVESQGTGSGGSGVSGSTHTELSTSPKESGSMVSEFYRSLSDKEDWEIEPNELVLGPRIGIGSYGEVYRAQWRETDIAVKRFLEQEVGDKVLEEFKGELALMKRLRHPNIVQFIGACTTKPNLCIVTQYVARGSLFKFLHRNPTRGKIDHRRKLQMALDVAKGMNYLHTCRPPVVHRDLKSPNLLVDKDLTIKVCDFGLSRVRRSQYLTSKTQAGTPEWTAPEVLRSQDCNESSDVYSFGVILWELLTEEEPWSDKSPMQVVGCVGWNGQKLAIPADADPEMQDLLERCFSEAEKRPSFSDIIAILRKELQALGPPSKPASFSRPQEGGQ